MRDTKISFSSYLQKYQILGSLEGPESNKGYFKFPYAYIMLLLGPKANAKAAILIFYDKKIPKTLRPQQMHIMHA